MATGVGMGFDFSSLNKSLKEADAKLSKLMQKFQETEKVGVKAFQNIANNGVGAVIKKLQEANKSLGSTSKIVDMINRIVMAFGKLKGETKVGISTKDSDAAIKKLQKEIAQLQKQQDKTAQQVDKWKSKYDNLAQSVKRGGDNAKNFQQTQSKMLDTAGQLKRALAAAFSVSAIRGYVNKLMQIRGEFELQQRSLQVLLQNKDEANALWDKTVALAVKSPYTTKQLVTATKQLAAYRIESEKLYETNKMLADVSIGLGVDMNRLILAFGQVKAANFLRGTELRQFSEAGVNMLDELAKRFTALEGRAVSVGEVFERVSKRMVSFKDVEAVFKTITSEGGTFYQMQEKQSETLKGMMLNLKDSYELMLNDIGKSNEGMLKGFVSFMRIFVDGWREAAVVIKTAGTAMLFYFAASKIAKIGSAFSGLWAAMAANPVGAIAAGVGVLIGLFVSLYQHTNKLNEALLEVEKNVGESLEESIGLYRKLTDTINDSTASLDERNKAYEELKTKFKDILPDQQLELEYIQDLKFSYKEAEDAMFSYYNAKAIEQKKSKIESLYEEGFATDEKDLIKGLKTYISESGRFTNEEMVKLRAGINKVVSSIIEDVKKGKIDASYESVYKALRERMTEFSGVEFEMQSADDAGVRKVLYNISQIIDSAKDYKEALSDIGGLPFQTYEQQQAYNAIQEHNKEMENAVSLYKHLVSLRQKLADNKVDLTSDKSTLNEKQLQDREWYLNDLNNTLNEINKLSPDVANGIKEIDKSLVRAAEKGSYEFAKSLGVAENALYNIFADKAKTLKGGNEGASAMLTNFAEGIKANAESKLATPLQQAIISAFDLAIKERDIDQKGKDLLATLLPDSKQTTEDVRKSVEALLKQYQDEVKKWENATAAGATKLPFVEYLNQFGNTEFKSAISQYLGSTEDFKNLEQKMIPVLEHIYKLLGGDPDKDKKGRSRDLVDERLRVIKEIYKAYKELNKTFDETTSKTGAMEKFGDAFYAAFGKTPEQMGYNLFTAEGVVDAYNKFISTLSKADDITKGNLAKGEFVMELQVEMQQKNDKAFQDQIEQMFSGYELSLELEKLNIPPDLAKQLFNVDTFDLSEIRTKLEQELYSLQTAGGYEDQIKKIQEFLKKVSQMEQDEQEERLKKYSKYLTKGMDERVRIKIEELRKLEEVEKDKDVYTEQQLADIRKAIQKETQEELDKQSWDDFKNTDLYISLFEDLENASNQSLNIMIDRLQSLRESLNNLPPEQLKEIVNQVEKAKEELEDRNPFKKFGNDLKDYFGNIGKRKETKRLIEEGENDIKYYQQQAKAQREIVVAYETRITKGEKLSEQEQKALEKARESLRMNEEATSNTETAQASYQKILDSIKKGADGIGEAFEGTGEFLNSMGSYISDMANKWEQAFGLSDKAKADIEAITGAAQAAGDIATGIGQMAGGDYLAGAMSLLSGIMSAFATAGKYNDDLLQLNIDAEAKSIERLQKVYEDLEEQIKNTYDISELNSATKAAQDNLLAQIAATERIISAEEDKKKSDQDAIDDYKDEIDDLKNSYKELEETRLQELGAFATDENKKSGAEAFLDAWMEAYKQTGDGLSGLNEQFDEFFEDSVKRQMLQKATSKYLENLFNKYDTAISDWAEGGLTDEELNEELSGLKNDLPALNEALKKWAEAVGIAADFAGKDAELSGLAAGISGITEDQADVLASYWNSVRGYTADTNAKVAELATRLFSDDTTANPMLAQLKIIATQTENIHTLLNSVITSSTATGGDRIKVYAEIIGSI